MLCTCVVEFGAQYGAVLGQGETGLRVLWAVPGPGPWPKFNGEPLVMGCMIVDILFRPQQNLFNQYSLNMSTLAKNKAYSKPKTENQ